MEVGPIRRNLFGDNGEKGGKQKTTCTVARYKLHERETRGLPPRSCNDSCKSNKKWTDALSLVTDRRGV